jgi:DtxR family Mn-dependent transcriptional regulator
LSNAFGDPRAYRIRGTLIALRKDQAAMVLVKPAAAGKKIRES